LKTEHEKNAQVFKALCDENRLRILEMLRGGENCACELLDSLEIGQSALSYHMKILVASGIVKSRQEGKWTHYRISEEGSRYASVLLQELTTIKGGKREASCCK
jgi:ArsR family transcriptional regulator